MINVAVTSKHPHVAFTTDGGWRVHASFKRSAPCVTERIERMRQLLGNLELAPLGSCELVLLSLVLFDGVHAARDLKPAWEASHSIRKWRNMPFIDWKDSDGVVERRYLSAFTVLAISHLSVVPSFDAVEESVRNALAKQSLCSSHVPPPFALSQLAQEAVVWAVAWLPPFLAMHTSGICRLACLPNSCLARESADKAITIQGTDDRAEAHMDNLFFHALEVEPPDQLTAKLQAALVAPAGLSDLQLRRLILERLTALDSTTLLLSADDALLCSWSCHLVRRGTPTTSPLDPRTAIEYIRLVLEPLHELLPLVMGAGVDDEEAWARLYREVLERAEVCSRHKVHAALTAFHAFSVERIGAPNLKVLTDPTTLVAPMPRANVVWFREVAWIRQQLAQLPDSRLRQQLQTVFELLVATGARIGEVLTVSLENLHLQGTEHLLFVIDPRPNVDRLKTPAARRSFVVRERSCIDVVERWKARRALEQAGPQQMSFASPHGLYRVWREIETRAIISAYLKAASGDSALSPHSLRHSLVTQTAFEASEDNEPERFLHDLSTSVGHECTSETLRDYFHGADQQLRKELRSINAQLEITLAAAAGWTGCNHDVLRKRKSRCNPELSDYVTLVVEDAASRKRVHDVREDFQCSERLSPYRPTANPALLPFRTVLNVCKDMSADVPLAAAAARCDVSLGTVRKVAAYLAGRAGMPSTEVTDDFLELRLAEGFRRLRTYADFSRVDRPNFSRTTEFACRGNRATELKRACRSWDAIRVGSYLSLERPSLAIELLELLSRSGISADRLIIRLAPRSSNDQKERRRLERDAAERIAAVFRAQPKIQHCSERRGRPRAYLLIRESAHASEPSPAQLSLGGLHALMLSACAWHTLEDESCRG